MPERPADLAGELKIIVSDHHADFYVRNQVAVLIEQQLHPYGRYGWWMPVPRPMLPEFIFALCWGNAYDGLRPWTRPDEPEWPIVLWPRVARLEARWRWQKARVVREVRGLRRWLHLR